MEKKEKLTGLLLCLVILGVVHSGCSGDKPPEGILTVETFAGVYAALVENERISSPQAVFNIRSYDADTTLARFGVTREQIERTMEYYDKDLRRWQEFYVEAMQLIEWGPGKKNLEKAKKGEQPIESPAPPSK